MGYFEEHKQTYINDFAKVMNEQVDSEFSTKEAKDIFKQYMYLAKNIKVDMRKKLFREIFVKGMKQAGYQFNNFGGELWLSKLSYQSDML